MFIHEQLAHPGSQIEGFTTLLMTKGTRPELDWNVKQAPVESHVWQFGAKHARQTPPCKKYPGMHAKHVV